MVGRQPNAPAAFTAGEIPGTHFQRLSRPQGTWFCRGIPRKKSPVTPPGVGPGTVRLVAQRLNHYATPGPLTVIYMILLMSQHNGVDSIKNYKTRGVRECTDVLVYGCGWNLVTCAAHKMLSRLKKDSHACSIGLWEVLGISDDSKAGSAVIRYE